MYNVLIWNNFWPSEQFNFVVSSKPVKFRKKIVIRTTPHNLHTCCNAHRLYSEIDRNDSRRLQLTQRSRRNYTSSCILSYYILVCPILFLRFRSNLWVVSVDYHSLFKPPVIHFRYGTLTLLIIYFNFQT